MAALVRSAICRLPFSEVSVDAVGWKFAAFRIPRPPLVKPRLETGLMPSMDEGAFVLDYWAPSGTPLKRAEEMAQELEHILSENPDVESYVRRTGSENGLFSRYLPN